MAATASRTGTPALRGPSRPVTDLPLDEFTSQVEEWVPAMGEVGGVLAEGQLSPDIPAARRLARIFLGAGAVGLGSAAISVVGGWGDAVAVSLALAAGFGSLSATAAVRYLSRGRL